MKTHELTVPAGLNAGDTFKHEHATMVVVQMGDELTAVEMVQNIAPGEIDPHALNRKHSPEAQKELDDSIREVGQSTPGIVWRKPDGRLGLVAGEGRWQSCKTLGRPFQAMIRDYSETEATEILLIDNAKREGLRPVDEAKIYDAMLNLRDAGGNRMYSLKRIAQRVHGDEKKESYVARVWKLLELPKDVGDALNAGVVPLRVAFLVARIADPKDREAAGKDAIKDKWTGKPQTVKQAEENIAKNFQVNLKGAGADFMKDTRLLNHEQMETMGFAGKPGEIGDGSCANCPFLAKNHPAFKDQLATSGAKQGKKSHVGDDDAGETGIDPNTCTRAKCYQWKLQNVFLNKAADFTKKHGLPGGLKLLPVSTKLNTWDSKYVPLDVTPSGYDTGNHGAGKKLPKWRSLLKGSEIPIHIGPDEQGEPVEMIERAVAIAWCREHHDGFKDARGPEVKVKDMSPAERERHAAKEKALAEKQKMERAIEHEIKVDSLREMHERICKKGLGIEGRKILAMGITRDISCDELLTTITGKEYKLNTAKAEAKALEEYFSGATQNDIDAFLAVAAVHDDVKYSGVKNADDFQALCEALGVDLKPVAIRVRKAHEIAAKKAADEAKAKAEQKASKSNRNSSDPTNVSTKKEASKTAAADKRAKERKQDGFFHCDTCGTVCKVDADCINDVVALKPGFFQCIGCEEKNEREGGAFAPALPKAQQAEFVTWLPKGTTKTAAATDDDGFDDE